MRLTSYLRTHTGARQDEFVSPRAVRNSFAARAGAQMLRAVPLRILQGLGSHRPVALCYHIITDDIPAHIRHLYPCKTPEQFEADLIFLQKHFQVISYPGLLDRLSLAEPVFRPAVLLTFDDGYSECFSVVRPLLLKYSMPCMFFLCPPVLDNQCAYAFDKASLCINAMQRLKDSEVEAVLAAMRAAWRVGLVGKLAFESWIRGWVRTMGATDEPLLSWLCERLEVDTAAYLRSRPYMSRDEVRTLVADGFTIGAHSLRHQHLASMDPHELGSEIVQSCRALIALGATAPVPFAFPFDADGIDRLALRLLRADHPEIGLLFDTRRFLPDKDFMVNRISVDRPPRRGDARSRLGGVLRMAYVDRVLWSVEQGYHAPP